MDLYKEMVKKCKFDVKTAIRSEQGRSIEYQAIVLKDIGTDLIIKITDFADYVIYAAVKDMEFYRTDYKVLLAVCQFLNYVFFEEYERYKITSIWDIKKEMFQEFINAYSIRRQENNKYPRKPTIEEKRAAICLFGETLCHYNKNKLKYLKEGDLVRENNYMDGYKKKSYKDYQISIRYMDDRGEELDQLFRDMPIAIADRFLKMSEIYAPDLSFPIVLQLYGGLRSGEVCNVRRKESNMGPGIILSSLKLQDKNGNSYFEVKSFQIDLTKEYVMRSDGKPVGKIKRKRYVSIYGPFVNVVSRYYFKHLKLVDDKICDPIKPMFPCKNKNCKSGIYYAMNKRNYIERVKRLFFNKVLPSLQNDADPDLSRFYYQMRQHTWGPHSFRHWFTVFLLYCGVDDVVTLQDLRGDKVPQSAETYLKRKGVLMRTYKKSLDTWGRMIKS